nr:hypothetical protein BaRGS_031605 [Batillaria attramentaria]
MSGCLDISDAGLASIATKLTKLETLRVNKCRMLTDSSVGLLKNLEKLHTLDMSECYEDVGLHKISSSLHCLRFLRLAWCKAITNMGLLGLKVEGICPLHDPLAAVIDGECSCTRKSNTPIIFRKPTAAIREKNEQTLKKMISELEQTVVPENISALTSLRSLDLSSCLQLSDIGLCGSIKFCELRVLKMNCLHGLTDAGLIDIANNNPGLEELQRLTHLDISNCDRLTDTALIHIGDNCKRLRHLDVSFCCGISPQAVDLLERRMHTLNTVLCRNVGISSFPILSAQDREV